MPSKLAFSLLHGTKVEAPISEAYRLINAVEEWPDFFPPCRAARVVSVNEDRVLVEITAQVGSTVRTWRSQRTLRADQHRVDFEQIDPFPPVKSMTGYWRVQPKTATSCYVELSHTFEVDDELAARAEPARTLQEAESWIRQVCNTNSEAELDAFRSRCEKNARAVASTQHE